MEKSLAQLEDSELQLKRQKLLEYADDAIEALHDVAMSADKDSARVSASAEILDRVGLVKPKEAPQGINLDPSVLVGAMAGIASIFGRQLSPAAAANLRTVVQVDPASAVQPLQKPRKRSRKAPASQKGEP